MKTLDSMAEELEERDRQLAAMAAEVERLEKIERAARRFYTFTHGGYRWEATDEKRDNLYDALMAAR
jgi:hypothetical protein